MVETRVLVAGLTLLAYAAVTKTDLQVRRRWKQYLVLGALNSAIPFLLVSTAEIRLTASMAVLLNATSPIFGAIVAAIFLRDPFTKRSFAGSIIAFTGVAMLVGWSPISHDISTILSIFACLAASLTYGFAGAHVRTVMNNAPAIGMATGTQLSSAIFIAPFAIISHPISAPTTTAICSVLALALISTTIAYILYYRLIQSAGPAKALSVTFLTPIFGLTWGALFIGESLTILKVAACAVILCGTSLLIGGKQQVIETEDEQVQPDTASGGVAAVSEA